MKKIILLLMLITPIFFSACEDAEELTGTMEFTIGDKTYDFPVATFIKQDGKTIVTSTEVSNSATIVFAGITPKTYPLGVGANLEEALQNLLGLENPDNAFIYYPTGNADSAYISLYGTLQVTEYTDSKVVGTFSGYGITKEVALGGVTDIITSQKKPFSGTFTAKAIN
jgi:hypothetical protein